MADHSVCELLLTLLVSVALTDVVKATDTWASFISAILIVRHISVFCRSRYSAVNPGGHWALHMGAAYYQAILPPQGLQHLRLHWASKDLRKSGHPLVLIFAIFITKWENMGSRVRVDQKSCTVLLSSIYLPFRSVTIRSWWEGLHCPSWAQETAADKGV